MIYYVILIITILTLRLPTEAVIKDVKLSPAPALLLRAFAACIAFTIAKPFMGVLN